MYRRTVLRCWADGLLAQSMTAMTVGAAHTDDIHKEAS